MMGSLIFLLLSLFLCSSPFSVYGASTALKGKYEKSRNLSDTAVLNWRIDEDNEIAHLSLTISDRSQVKSDSSSYLGIGIGEPLSGSMLGADIVTAEFSRDQDDSCKLTDRHVPSVAYPLMQENGQPNPEVFPVEDFCENDWKLVNCARDTEKGALVLEVSRALDVGNDTQDRKIGPGEQQIMYAYGGSFAYHGKYRSSVAMVLYGERETGLTDEQKRQGMTAEDAEKDIDNEQKVLMAAYKVPEKSTTYACTGRVLDIPDGDEITMIGAEPVIEKGNEEVVHHFLLYACQNNDYFQRINGKGRDCMRDSPLGSPQANCTGVLYGWAKGGERFMFPKVTGFEIGQTNKYIIVETHYDNPAGRNDIVDSSGVNLLLTSKKREQPGGILVVGDPVVTYNGDAVESKEYEYTCPSECTSRLEKPLTVFGIGYHMHRTGKRIWTNHYSKDGSLIARREHISFWSDSWQKFAPTSPWVINPGDVLTTTGEFDTSKTNGTKWGLATTDEMLMEFLFVYPRPRNKGTGGYLYNCGVIAEGKANATICSGPGGTEADMKQAIIPIPNPNPSLRDTAGLKDSFGEKPSVCRQATTTATADSPTPSDGSEDDDPECFPASATVELESGAIVSMDKLSIGDRVKVSSGKYSDIYFFSHRDPRRESSFIKISTSAAGDDTAGYDIMASRSHLIITRNGLKAAKSIEIGEILYNEFRTPMKVASVKTVKASGLYSPHTMHGDILVNGVQASTYSNYLPISIAHALLLPERLSYGFGFSVFGRTKCTSNGYCTRGRPFVVEQVVWLWKALTAVRKSLKLQLDASSAEL